MGGDGEEVVARDDRLAGRDVEPGVLDGEAGALGSPSARATSSRP